MPITRPTTKTIISTTGWGIPITDEVNRLTTDVASTKPTAWTNLSLANGWVTYGITPQYRKVGDIVYLRGTVNGGARGSTITTLPAGFRPPVNLNFIVYHWPNTQSACWVSVANTGIIQTDTIDGGTLLTYVNLDQIFFALV